MDGGDCSKRGEASWLPATGGTRFCIPVGCRLGSLSWCLLVFSSWGVCMLFQLCSRAALHFAPLGCTSATLLPDCEAASLRSARHGKPCSQLAASDKRVLRDSKVPPCPSRLWFALLVVLSAVFWALFFAVRFFVPGAPCARRVWVDRVQCLSSRSATPVRHCGYVACSLGVDHFLPATTWILQSFFSFPLCPLHVPGPLVFRVPRSRPSLD